jgi:hypothetical protein
VKRIRALERVVNLVGSRIFHNPTERHQSDHGDGGSSDHPCVEATGSIAAEHLHHIFTGAFSRADGSRSRRSQPDGCRAFNPPKAIVEAHGGNPCKLGGGSWPSLCNYGFVQSRSGGSHGRAGAVDVAGLELPDGTKKRHRAASADRKAVYISCQDLILRFPKFAIIMVGYS